jgi:hypothetical protein
MGWIKSNQGRSAEACRSEVPINRDKLRSRSAGLLLFFKTPKIRTSKLMHSLELLYSFLATSSATWVVVDDPPIS